MAMKTISLEQEINPWEAQAARFDFAAQKLNLDEGLMKVLRYPTREIILHIPVTEQFNKIVSHFLDVLHRIGPVRVSAQLNFLPGREVGGDISSAFCNLVV